MTIQTYIFGLGRRDVPLRPMPSYVRAFIRHSNRLLVMLLRVTKGDATTAMLNLLTFIIPF